MPVYGYKGISSNGKEISGLVDADSIAAAKTKLRKEGVFPTFVGASTGGGHTPGMRKEIKISFLNRVKTRDLADMTRLLATLIGANVPLVESLTAVMGQLTHVKLRSVVTNLKERVNEGSSLGQAMEAHPDIFSNLFINMVKAGEASGSLDQVLNELAEYTEKQAGLKSKVMGAMAYPAVMSGVGVIIMIFLFAFVIPKITTIFDSMKAALPLPTVILLAISGAVTNYWWAIIIVVGLTVYFIRKWLDTPKGKAKFDAWSLKLPIFGKLFRLVNISRIMSTLATLLAAGVPMLSALGIVKNLMSNDIFRKVIENTIEEVSGGAALAEPLKKSGEFPPVVIHMIAVGEKTGQLEEMLKKVSSSYDQQTETTISALTSMMEPLIIVAMGVSVGFVVMAVMLPIFNLNQMAH